MLHTRICELLEIEHPIINAPMAGPAHAELRNERLPSGTRRAFKSLSITSKYGAIWVRWG